MAAKKSADTESKPKKDATAKPGKLAYRNTKKAQEGARHGDPDGAIVALTAFADAGDVAACYSLAELAAYRGDFPQVLDRLAPLLPDPYKAVRAGNVVEDALGLLWRAGRETKDWARVGAIAKAASKDVLRDAWKAGFVAQLLALADANGKGPPLSFETPRPKPLAERRADWEITVTKARAAGDTLRMFQDAVHQGLDETSLELYPQVPPGKVDFHHAAEVARILVRAGRAAEAWDVLAPSIPGWHPVDFVQIAPALLIYDATLETLMTKERCAWVLATKRGA